MSTSRSKGAPGVPSHRTSDATVPSRPDANSTPAPRSGVGDALAESNPLPSLPPLVAGDDPASRAAVERWMDDDRSAHDDGPAPQPYRVLPPSRPVPIDRAPARPSADDDDTTGADEADDGYEDPLVRTWREEREFEAQFGQWRAGARPPMPMRRSTLVSPPVLLLAFVLVVVLYYALTT